MLTAWVEAAQEQTLAHPEEGGIREATVNCVLKDEQEFLRQSGGEQLHV